MTRPAVALVGFLVLAGCTSGSAHPPAGRHLRVVQFNLCDSGIARCYTGRAVDAAAAVIRAERPDLVTLNEVCRGDVSALARTLEKSGRGDAVTSAFRAATQTDSGAPVRCRNGEQYGIGLLARRAASTRPEIRAGRYAAQDPGDTEQRVWLCLRTPGLVACTTHLSSTSPGVALHECHQLLDVAIPKLRSGRENVIVGGDLNLHDGGAPDVRSCVPPGYRRADDGARQHVLVSDPVAIVSRRTIDLHGTTDHPGLVVDLALR